MPSIGAATAMIVSERIDRAVRASFDEQTQRDALRFLDLSSKAGDKMYVAMAATYGPLLTIAIATSVSPGHVVWGLFTGVSCAALLFLAVRSRKKARLALDALVASDPEYWRPLSEKLKRIVLQAGRFDDGLAPSQATQAVD